MSLDNDFSRWVGVVAAGQLVFKQQLKNWLKNVGYTEECEVGVEEVEPLVLTQNEHTYGQGQNHYAEIIDQKGPT